MATAKKYALFGENLYHSLSVPIHEALFRINGIKASYFRMEAFPDYFADNVLTVKNKLAGFNVTIPYKLSVMPALNVIDPEAGQIGAVNTVANENGCLVGYNTDVPGLRLMLRHMSAPVDGSSCYILGTGGAARAAMFALKSMGAKSVRYVSRTNPKVLSYDRLQDEFHGILVNATPAGMFPDVEGCPIARDRLPSIIKRATAVVDLIYNPKETVLTKAAEKAGVLNATGLYMLVSQAVKSEEIWQDASYPMELVDQIVNEIKDDEEWQRF